MTLGELAAEGARLIAFCLACGGQVEPYLAELADRYGAETMLSDWRTR